jgi:hypothetical protein
VPYRMQASQGWPSSHTKRVAGGGELSSKDAEGLDLPSPHPFGLRWPPPDIAPLVAAQESQSGAVNEAVGDRLGSFLSIYTSDGRDGGKHTDPMHPVARTVLFSPPNTAKQAPTVQPKYICRLPIRI